MGTSKKVCVIGAGPSGLVAARELQRGGHTPVVYEQHHDVGGQWLYQPNLANPSPEVHSSVYESLRTAVPREVMGFTDFPFEARKEGGGDTRTFPSHREVWSYLKDFCDCFRLYDVVQFNTRVVYVGMPESVEVGGKEMKWAVRSQVRRASNEGAAGEEEEEVFDAVVVATGEFSHPTFPTIKGMDAWEGKQLHSHIYRTPDIFKDEVVVIVGSSLSGREISLELTRVAKSVHLSSKSTVPSEGLSNTISKYDNFHYHPQIIAFYFFELQAKWVSDVLAGKLTLPTPEDMMKSAMQFYHFKDVAGIPKRKTHEVGDFEYCDRFADRAGFPRAEEWKKRVF